MRFSFRLMAAGAMVAGMSLAVVAPGGIAAAKAKQVTGACTSLSGDETSQSETGCNQTGITGGSGTISTVITGSSGTYTTDWASGLTSTGSVTFKEYLGKKDKCPAGPPGTSALAEAKSTSKDTGGTATTLIGSKKFKATTCAYSDSSEPDGILVENYPGTSTPF